MVTTLKLVSLSIWVIGVQISTVGASLATPQSRGNTDQVYAVSTSVLNQMTSQTQVFSVEMQGYKPPSGTGGPGRTGDTGTR
ncbi:MAG: hypothetical protein KME16_05625 [Scytolyngbya sp. HA4215-MV1]|jgi:hypothetical protein|nr:hypothetical protein [Scytolyngbya sp. HA4215-MV1]